MPTNLNIDDKLLALAQKVCGFKTKRDTVNEALRLMIQRKSLRGAEKHFGTIDFREDFLEEMDRKAAKRAAQLSLKTTASKNPGRGKGR